MHQLAAALICAAISIAAGAAQDTMDTIDTQVAERFAAFDQRREPLLVQQALEAIETAARQTHGADAALRKQSLARQLRFLASLDRIIDPAWNESDVPPQGVAPPLANVTVQPSGEVDPAAIPDPAMRAEYVRALQASKDAVRRYDVQYQLRRVDEQAVQFLGTWVGENYGNSASDRSEFESALTNAPLTEARRQRVRSVLARAAT